MRRLLVLFALCGCAHFGGAERPPKLRVRVTVTPEAAPQGATGRLIVIMGEGKETRPLSVSAFFPTRNAFAAAEVRLEPGHPVEIDPDALAYPRPLSQMPPGLYRFTAILDVNHDYNYYDEADEGDLRGPVVRLQIDDDRSKPVELTLDRRVSGRMPVKDTDDIKLVTFESPLLSAFWGRPITMRAGVVLPPSYARETTRRYPTLYDVHGYGADHRVAWMKGPGAIQAMRDHKRPEQIIVFLDGQCPQGHHEFADSQNDGPWGRALVEEFIPYLEAHFRMEPQPWARFVTGHSSGGWSSLWLEITHPDFFGGTWSTSPDPVDMRSFTGIDASPGSTDNAYRRKDGSPHNLMRLHGKDLVTFEEFARKEAVLGDLGGQLASFEYVFSPRGEDGRPQRMFDRETGALNQAVLRAWERWDIRKVLESNWSTLGPKLSGKLHIIVGSDDNFHLEEAVHMLCDFLARAKSDARCEFVPGRDHMDLYRKYTTYPDGLDARIAREAQAVYEAHAGGGS